MSELDQLRAGDEKLEAQETSLNEKLLALKKEENAAMTKMRELGQQLRKTRAARAEIGRMIKEEENPTPPVTPEVRTIIESVTATAQAATGPPRKKA
jgi:chromosome segregation ATPase